MLSDYAMYIENIRNGLIQCGVDFPQIDNIEEADYWSLFNIGEKLSDIMYFYKIMACSGNMIEMFVPMNKSYRGIARLEAFEEFSEDILPYLKEQLGDEDGFIFSIDDLCDIDGFVEEDEEEPEEWVNEDIDAEDILVEASDLFGDGPKEVSVVEQFEKSGGGLWGIDASDCLEHGTDLLSIAKQSDEVVEYVQHGVNIFGVTSSEEQPEWVSHGTELFDISTCCANNALNDSSNDNDLFEDDEDIWDESPEGSDMPEEDTLFNDDPEDIWDDSSEDDELFEEDVEDIWDESSEGNNLFNDDPDDVWVEESEELSEDISKSSEEQDEALWEESSEDEWSDESTDDSENLPKEVWSDNPDDVWASDEYNSNGSQDSGSSELKFGKRNVIDWEDPPEVSVTKESGATKPINHKVNLPHSSAKPATGERDIVDSVQEAASAALTSAKKFLTRLTNPVE